MSTRLPPKFLARLKEVTAKRPRTVIDHILKHGHITTQELRDVYGYNHPPRAARDVRECGIPLEMFKVTARDGRKIAAYRFGDFLGRRTGRHRGRQAFPKTVKKTLLVDDGARCGICCGEFSPSHLQVDHRVPYEVGGEPSDIADVNAFMLLCGSCNRAKSWSCEHCPNWIETHSPAICRDCYWGNPTHYSHIMQQPTRRVDIVWQGKEVAEYDAMLTLAALHEMNPPDFVKQILRRSIERPSSE